MLIAAQKHIFANNAVEFLGNIKIENDLLKFFLMLPRTHKAEIQYKHFLKAATAGSSIM